MADLKDEVSAGLATRLAGELATAWPAFPADRFTSDIGVALAPLALMARVELLADRLAEALPTDFDTAADVLWSTLDSPTFAGWMTLPCGTYVGRAGIDRPDVALPLLAGLTPRWSSEGPIRPFIERHPDLTYRHLHRWVLDPDEHVRRLVSEGHPPSPPMGTPTPWARRRSRPQRRAARPARRRPLPLRAALCRQPPERHHQGPPRCRPRPRPEVAAAG